MFRVKNSNVEKYIFVTLSCTQYDKTRVDMRKYEIQIQMYMYPLKLFVQLVSYFLRRDCKIVNGQFLPPFNLAKHISVRVSCTINFVYCYKTNKNRCVRQTVKLILVSPAAKFTVLFIRKDGDP